MGYKTEQKFIDAMGGSDILNKILEHNDAKNQIKLTAAANDLDLLAINAWKRKNKDGQWSENRTLRNIIEMPPEVALQVERRIPGFFTDQTKKTMKKAIHDDPFLQQFLTVPLDTI